MMSGMDTGDLAERITPTLKIGEEPIHVNGQPTGFLLRDFWASAFSDLVLNANRGTFAEYVVMTALGRGKALLSAWASHDVTTNSGIRVEVKSAAYLQTWPQERLSRINFEIRPTRKWREDLNDFEPGA